MTKVRIGILVLFPMVLLAQRDRNRFQMSLTFPPTTQASQLNISYYNGRDVKTPKVALNHGAFKFSDSLFSKFAAVEVRYFNEFGGSEYTGFFVKASPAAAAFTKNGSGKVLEGPRLTNVLTFEEMGKRGFDAFIQKETTAFKVFFASNADKLGSSDSIQQKLQRLSLAVARRKLQYIRDHGDKYYSFYAFRTQLLNAGLNPDTLYQVFKTAFPDQLQHSNEGLETVQLVLAERDLKAGHQAPKFRSVDAYGKSISSEELGGKYFLIDFWASWCGPCIKEFPVIKDIRMKYSKDKLEIISVSLDKDSTAFIRAVKKNQMNWRHIYNDRNLVKTFNGFGVPAIYLVSPSGTIVYSRNELKDIDHLSKLKSILGQLLK